MRLYELNSDPRSQDVDPKFEDVCALLEKHCSEALKVFDKVKVFRGIKTGKDDIYRVDPKLQARKSSYTYNYYTLLFDNLPNWQRFPKRSLSLICSTSEIKGRGYSRHGGVYCVLPYDGARFGVCPREDIWEGFRETLHKDLGPINDFFKSHGVLDSSYKELLETTLEKKRSLCTSLRYRWINYMFWDAFERELSSATNIEQVEKAYAELFDPVANDFEVETVSHLPRTIYELGREVWTSSTCYLVNTSSKLYQQLLLQYKG